MGKQWVFDGHIAGIGAQSGLRAVVGVWQASPLGPFADVMVQLPSGQRILLAPAVEVADFVSATYSFDVVRVVAVDVQLGRRKLAVNAGPLQINAEIGRRTPLGFALRAVPRPLAVHPRWLRAVDPLAGLLSPGARTSGTAGNGRRETYGVTDVHRISTAEISWEGRNQGTLAPIQPAVTFGFSSVPAQPSVARVRTTIVAGTGRR
ncbi:MULTISPECIES: hypothetical protein [unclassified Arthrobacter]|uniref:hypothetical protein n=1 Tax=unclassified Arthrobacter TaxID=235627 RepID=UPI0033924859